MLVTESDGYPFIDDTELVENLSRFISKRWIRAFQLKRQERKGSSVSNLVSMM